LSAWNEAIRAKAETTNTPYPADAIRTTALSLWTNYWQLRCTKGLFACMYTAITIHNMEDEQQEAASAYEIMLNILATGGKLTGKVPMVKEVKFLSPDELDLYINYAMST
jgi:hypothetical protein